MRVCFTMAYHRKCWDHGNIELQNRPYPEQMQKIFLLHSCLTINRRVPACQISVDKSAADTRGEALNFSSYPRRQILYHCAGKTSIQDSPQILALECFISLIGESYFTKRHLPIQTKLYLSVFKVERMQENNTQTSAHLVFGSLNTCYIFPTIYHNRYNHLKKTKQ